MKLNLQQNALYTLYHAVEHLKRSGDDDSGSEGRSFDHESHIVEWRNPSGHVSFYLTDFARPPAEYELTFALSHFIQASELILKAYLERFDPQSLFKPPGSTRTVNLREALAATAKHAPDIILPDQAALMLRAKDIRNAIAHYQFAMDTQSLQVLAADFLALCMYLSQALLGINIVEAFSWDSWRDEPDPIGDYLASLALTLSPSGMDAAFRTAEEWSRVHPGEMPLLCLNCGSKGVIADRFVCIACGAEADPEIARLVQDFDELAGRVNAIRKASKEGQDDSAEL